MKRVRFFPLLLIIGCCMAMVQPCSSQTITNTANTITLSGTCLNDRISTGTYTLGLEYVDPDNGPTWLTPVSVSVVVSGSVATITLPSSILPTPATNGYWSLADTDDGSISLTGGTGGGIAYWYHDPNATLNFNCDPLFDRLARAVQYLCVPGALLY